MFKKILKEGIIFILLLAAVVLILAVLFYDYIPTGKVVPVVEQYQTSESVQKEIDETINTEQSEIVVTYDIDNTDLKTYEKSKDYDKGKENPFAEYSVESNGEGATPENNGSSSGNSSNSTTNTATEGQNDGTFFNSTKTK